MIPLREYPTSRTQTERPTERPSDQPRSGKQTRQEHACSAGHANGTATLLLLPPQPLPPRTAATIYNDEVRNPSDHLGTSRANAQRATLPSHMNGDEIRPFADDSLLSETRRAKAPTTLSASRIALQIGKAASTARHSYSREWSGLSNF